MGSCVLLIPLQMEKIGLKIACSKLQLSSQTVLAMSLQEDPMEGFLGAGAN